jgi:hypothetical protein
MLRDAEHKTDTLHPRKWNHDIYTCECSGKREGGPNHNCCRKIKIKESLDTNLVKLQPNFGDNRNQILEERKKKREEELTKGRGRKGGCPYDECPDHHSPSNTHDKKKIQKFIAKKAKKYNQQLKKDKL